MDIQLKRGLLDACVLASIRGAPSYGYQIIKDLKPYVEMSESTLYPILRRLEGSGALTVYTVEHSGRLRKFYHMTADGRRQLESFAEDWNEIAAMYEYIRGGLEHDEDRIS